MDHITHTLQQAAGHVKIAIRRLAGKYPFHAKTLERFNLRAQADVPTMGVAFVGDDLLLLYSPAFVLGRPLDQLVGVLLHEIHHVIFGHLLMDPADYPDEWARTVAEEVTVNEFVTEPLPKGVIKLKQFPKLPARESTDRRYQRLKRIGKRLPLSSPAALLSGQLGNAGANGNGAGQNKDARGNVLDDHSVWQTVREGGQRAEDAIRAAVQGAAIDVGAAGIPDYLREGLSGGVDWPGGRRRTVRTDRTGPGQARPGESCSAVMRAASLWLSRTSCAIAPVPIAGWHHPGTAETGWPSDGHGGD